MAGSDILNEEDRTQILVFSLEERLCALPLSAVERVIRAVEITPLPKAPEIVQGVINVHGRIIPVVDVRTRFRLPARALDCDDRLIIAVTPGRAVALAADRVVGIRVIATEAMVVSERALPFAEYIRGVVKFEEDLALIYDLDGFLSLDEGRELDAALSGEAP
jgi:purine-binding chemotaxis protein CheW